MKKNFKRHTIALLTIATLCQFNHAFASDFSLPFVNASGLGTAYSGWASSADDASTAYTNPAGLVKIRNPQFVVSANGLFGGSQFSGTAVTPPSSPMVVQTGTASTSLRAFMPALYYSIPLSDRVVFALSQTVPFGLGTSYPTSSIVRYSATRTQVVVIDLGPSIGIKLNDKWSAGLGIDFNRINFTINSMFGPFTSTPDSNGQNHLHGWGYGWHGGLLYQMYPRTTLGLSFNSMVMFHAVGNSQVFGPAGQFSSRQRVNAALPARTQLSINQDVNDRLTLMGTLFYTNWKTLQQLSFQNTVIPGGSTLNTVVIPFQYHNTFDYSVGLSYKASEKLLLRTGVQFLQTPSNNHDRSVADPIGTGTIVAIGARYQQNRHVTYDVGYARSFFRQMAINVVKPGLTTLSGNSNSYSNVLGAQITWNFV